VQRFAVEAHDLDLVQAAGVDVRRFPGNQHSPDPARGALASLPGPAFPNRARWPFR
jgi:hypothetical protein